MSSRGRSGIRGGRKVEKQSDDEIKMDVTDSGLVKV